MVGSYKNIFLLYVNPMRPADACIMNNLEPPFSFMLQAVDRIGSGGPKGLHADCNQSDSQPNHCG